MNPLSGSSTALTVPFGIQTLWANKKLSINRFHQQATQKFVEEAQPYLNRLTSTLIGEQLYLLCEYLTIPNIRYQYFFRKWFIQKSLEEIFSKDPSDSATLIILGAGYDPLGSQIAEESEHVSVIEFDHPATQEVKQKTCDTSTQKNLTLISFNFETEELSSELLKVSKHKKVIVVAEALFMFLREETMKSILNTISHSFDELELIFTFLEKRPDGKVGHQPQRKIVDLWLQWVDEPFLWDTTIDSLTELMGEYQFQIKELRSSHDLHNDYLKETRTTLPLPPYGEWVCRVSHVAA